MRPENPHLIRPSFFKPLIFHSVKLVVVDGGKRLSAIHEAAGVHHEDSLTGLIFDLFEFGEGVDLAENTDGWDGRFRNYGWELQFGHWTSRGGCGFEWSCVGLGRGGAGLRRNFRGIGFWYRPYLHWLAGGVG